MIVTIYKITNLVNGKCYTGITKQTSAFRWRQHVLLALRGGRKGALQGAIVKYGEKAFEVSDIYEATSVREAQAVERGLIAQYGTMWPNGYNMSTGGELKTGYSVSADTKRKMRETALGRIISDKQRAIASANMKKRLSDPTERQKVVARLQSPGARAASAAASSALRSGKPGFFLGKTHTAESKEKISAKSKGRPAWNRGVPMSEEQKALLVSIHTGRKQSKETIEKRREASLRPENVAIRSAKMKALWADPVWRADLLKKRSQVPQRRPEWTPEQRSAGGDRMRKIMADPKRKARASEAGKAQWDNPVKHAEWAAAAKERGRVKSDVRKFGASTAAVRALARKLPAVIYPREVAA